MAETDTAGVALVDADALKGGEVGGDVGAGAGGSVGEPAARARASRAWRRGWPARLFFPLLLVVFATIAFTLDLGRLGDDHGAYMRNPETGAITAYTPDARFFFHNAFSKDGMFWRPLFMPWFLSVTNLLWNQMWLQNLLDAALHIMVGVVLLVLLRALRINRAAAVVTTAVFLVYPVFMQVVFWKSSSGTSIAAGLLLLAYLASVSFARHPRRWWLLPMLAGLGFAVPAFNEQPAPALAVIPLIYMAALARGWTWKRQAVRLAAVTAAPGLTCGLYVTMMAISGPGVYKIVKLGDLGPRLDKMIPDLFAWIAMLKCAGPSFAAGLGTLRDAGVLGLAAAGALVAAAGPWLRRMALDATPGPEAPPFERDEVPRHLLLAAAALAAFVLSCVGVLAVQMYQIWESRYIYAPAVAMALLLAVGLDAVVRGWARLPSGIRTVAGPFWRWGLCTVLIAGAVTSLGMAEPFRRRANWDVAQGEALKKLVPDPPSPAFFMPMVVGDTMDLPPGWRWSLPIAYSSWQYPWSVRHRLPVLYKRMDVCSGYSSGPRVLGVEADGLRYQEVMPLAGPYFAPHPSGGFFVPWSSVIPFVIGADGSVAVVTRLRLPDGREMDMPALKALVESGRLPARTEPLAM